ncbi:MAG: hypothetical protein ACXWV8_02435 [Chitinophagaceae bacterium]
MIKHLLVVLIFIAFNFVVSGQSQRLLSLLPGGFTILDSASGDINRDGKKDWLIILRNDNEEVNADTTRPLLLLLGSDNGKYQLSERNDSIVLCRNCGGSFGDPYAGITVKNNFFSIEHYGGSSWRWTRIITFKYDIKRKQFVLHRDAGISYHNSDPGKTTQNIHNKQDFGKMLFSKFSYNKIWR